MPPERTIPRGKRPPFNPPRPRNAPTKPASTSTSKPKTTARRATDSNLGKRKSSSKNAPISRSSPGSPEASDAASSPNRGSPSSSRSSREPDYILAEIINSGPSGGGGREEIESADPMIPSKLLTRILHHHFQDEKTKIAKDANRVVAKYVDIFVREALARAAFERTEGQKESAGDDIRGRVRAKVDSYLEVEDLEKLAPQLALDF